MSFNPLARTGAALFALSLAACGGTSPGDDGSGAAAKRILKAETVLPPGQSGFWNNEDQARGSGSGNPGDYGEHVDDQRLMYWSFNAKPGSPLGQKPGEATTPKEGVEIYRDEYGVPIVYAPTTYDLWFGVGYAIAQDRLFLMDAVRRTGEGTFAALAGCGFLPADVQQRTTTYSQAEYNAFFEQLSQEGKDFFQGYVDGANAWLDVVATDPSLLPAEYTLLSATPEPFTVNGALAGGVYITRFVAAEGGNEFLNIRMIEDLADAYGSQEAGLDAFLDMIWLDDPKAVTSVPPGRTFSNQPAPATDRETVFRAMAAWALDESKVPKSVQEGLGTGNADPVGTCAGLPVAVAPQSLPGSGATKGPAAAPAPGRSPEETQKTQQLLAALSTPPKKSGHSFGFAIGPGRTRDGGTLLISAPQLGYSYPLLLVELEIHGAGYDARGSSVPMLPTVGIGYTDYAAWALTTGYSKTIDSFIETICSTTQVLAMECTANQYFHDGAWKDMVCRQEEVFYRNTQSGAPVGPASFSETYEVCRTVHGPIVARDDDTGVARSLQYAMWNKELDTLEGIIAWNRARDFTGFKQGIEKVSWNENITFATRDGHFGYVHPGRFPSRHPETDMRLPIPGTGEYDFGPDLPFAQLPQAIDHPQGFVANWNNKPAQGWLDGEGYGSTSRPGGPGQRVTNLLEILGTRDDWTFADLRNIDIHAGTIDPRAREYLPVIASFKTSATLDDVQAAAVDHMLGWDKRHYNLEIDIEDSGAMDTPGATIFHEFVVALREELFGAVIVDGTDSEFFKRVSGVGSHLFDQSVMDNLVVRVLNPESSGLEPPRRDYANGRSRDEVMKAALDVALDRLAFDFNGGDPMTAEALDACTRVHPRSQICSLTRAVGPGSDVVPGTECVTMPYQDRGSWVHRVGYEFPDESTE